MIVTAFSSLAIIRFAQELVMYCALTPQKDAKYLVDKTGGNLRPCLITHSIERRNFSLKRIFDPTMTGR